MEREEADQLLDVWYDPVYERDRRITTLVVALFVVLTGLGVAMAAGLILPEILFADPSGRFPDGGVYTDLFVPPHIYLFSFLGALAHVFIVMFLNPVYWDASRFRYQLTAASVRIPLAVLLSTGLYLLTALFGFDFPGRTLAGVSFLVGLYVKEMVMALVAVVERVFKIEGVDLQRFYFGTPADTRTLACERCGTEETPRTLVDNAVVCADCLTDEERAAVAEDVLGRHAAGGFDTDRYNDTHDDAETHNDTDART